MRNPENRYIGWVVMRECRSDRKPRIFKKCPDEASAHHQAAEFNRHSPPDVLFFAEYWSTSSVVDVEAAK